ncbi:pyrroline-5-carboxylate reductase ProI [Bacillus paranthracis]|uniref:Pyrroline-5-carboxylate reductase n=7 Tax=Bacillus cereus group TaxID=86661 RepID=A0A5M9GQE7_9BACI|nr:MULTISPECIES: pyrroline-5-carboxylate reductase ProI [Bacillus]ACJ82529.1 pyrroline-5-carboxylate reductase [Bacillus cereus AH187]ACM14354.1 pyrroline-5-carboxylate reductase [Bacillus cereus Q1]EDZ56834.1 pyrroline-5-carboxylate reductase [Bacillus cereus H3081.97]EEK98949.1 Pyrroline-5-carboxylate reductase [Bacillus cereus BDRD-ST26]EJP94709.1 pyrroline-5-carboxylate reductase [Bacillus cereus IS075]EJQ02938.1 pyrroline-5-carboxylate reductase [Bacillus cereus AND1407]EJR22127.1 pyrro
MSIQNISFLGAGSIAEAIIGGLLHANVVKGEQITVSNRSNETRLQELHNKYGVKGTHNKKELLTNTNILFLAMKPKDVAEALTPFKEDIHNNLLIISLLAGVSTHSIRNLLQKDVPIIRAMPNTSAAILKSATAISSSKHATKEHIQTAIALFETIGLVSVVEEEEMHAVTALSGSGPAYIYYVVEAMEEAAKKIGLKEDVAKSLILQTMIGAAEMLKASEKHPSILRKEITSPGGTTEAGIEVLQEHQFQQALISCITQAAQRSHNLGKTLEQLTKEK